ncbi:MAG: DUF1883 domain-containing protein [Chloroflexi bacterium]|nr:DUF1883 domain-containing protein [Chloroflexota bacterium]
MTKFVHSDLGYRRRGDVLEVTLSHGANVRLLDSSNLRKYRRGERHRYQGGLAKKSPVHIEIPSSGHWHVVVDMQGLRGSTRAGFRVIDGSALKPLPPIRERRTQIAELLDNAYELAGADDEREFDVFISHATEDKDAVVRPLAHALQYREIDVWYDEFELRVGDSLRRRIDSGIARSRFGLVVLSKAFFAKGWTQYELDGLVTMAIGEKQILLPIWHEISKDEVVAQSPSLADRVALRTSDFGIDEIADEIAAVIADRR